MKVKQTVRISVIAQFILVLLSSLHLPTRLFASTPKSAHAFSVLRWKEKNNSPQFFELLQTPQNKWTLNNKEIPTLSILSDPQNWILFFPTQPRNIGLQCQWGEYQLYFKNSLASASPKKETGCIEDERFKNLYNAFNKLQTHY